MSTRGIPFVDVSGQDRTMQADIEAAMSGVVRSGGFIGGPEVTAFEEEFAGYLGIPPGRGCSSGTSALSLLLEAADVGSGDEVILPALTFIATAEAVVQVGAHPVLVDVEPASYTIDPVAAEAAVTSRTAAVLPVHLYGTPARIDPLLTLARQRGLLIVEDAAQSHLATYRGRPAGSLGDAAGFSFYPAKNLGAYGDAGYLTAADPALVARAGVLLDHGRISKYEHAVIGHNERMDAIQAAVLRVKLRRLRDWTSNRRAAAARYDGHLRPAGFKVIDAPADVDPVYHLYVVEVSNRDEVMCRLDAEAIGCGVHYPVPLHRQPALAALGYPDGSFPHSESAAARVVSLPMDGVLPPQAVDRVCEVFLSVARP
ncbi:MAG TPA: DegT/DnrJ/EryC1/StrS family aminotransferase [Acidimicrobiales bacterium]|nr:DegT/DnrJ/EryC1/StrS family aminotransferase [Acidimicrobiales bacterium]